MPAPTFEGLLLTGSHTLAIDENSRNGTTVFDVDANDGDGGATDADITYTITGGNTDVDGDGNDAFTINANTGVITVNDLGDLDFENAINSFSLTIEADDGQAMDNTSTATLNVNLNDQASAFVVDTLVDEDDGNFSPGDLSLREALGMLDAGGNITFDASLAGGTITLGGTQLQTFVDFTIDGDINGDNRADIAISGDNASRVFKIQSGTATLDALTITDGRPLIGGDFNGGGILVNFDAGANVINSTITKGKASFGGGIHNSGILNITNSVISENQAFTDGGGIFNTFLGGGTFVTIDNSTIYANTARVGGGILNFLQMRINNSTITGNSASNVGGGIHNTSGLFLANTIIAGNAATNGRPDTSDVNPFSFRGVNILSQPGAGRPEDIIETDMSNIFATLGAAPLTGVTTGVLADNGGVVQTIALSTTSVALNAADNAFLPADTQDIDGDNDTAEAIPFDGRGAGFNRVNNTTADIGAFELPTMNTPADAIDDAFTVTESGAIPTGNVFDDNGGGADTDPDDPLLVTQVNGNAGDVGNQITLPSGALLTLNSDGTFSYNPNGAFDFLPDFAASGASNATAIDTFTYQLNGEDTATVTITINGEDSDFDILIGTPGIDTLDAGIGDDTVEGLASADSLDGGDGTDTLSYANSSAAVTANLSSNTFNGGDATGDTVTNFENIEGSAFDDLLVGDVGGNSLKGSGGNDLLNGSSGDDVVDGGDGDDTLLGGAGGDAFKGGAGTDTLSYFNSDGGVQVDLDAETFAGAHAAGDSFIAGVDVENLSGSTFDDTLTGTGGDNIVIGFSGNDTIDGLAGEDQLDGQQGDDILTGGAGADALNGGTGTDTASYAGSSAAVSVNLLTGAALNGDAAGDALNSIESLTGSAFDDTLTGNGGVNVIEGLGGNDAINGLTGDDTLSGGAGDDVLVGSGGGDMIDGGADIDTASYFNSGAGVMIDLLADTASGGQATGDNLDNIENVLGSNGGSDVLTGDDGGNWLFGYAGSDTLTGGLGDDILFMGVADGVTDTAIYGASGFGNDSIAQFEDGIDIMDVSALGITFVDVNATPTGAGNADTTINFTGVSGQIVLTNFNIANLDASDFDFGTVT